MSQNTSDPDISLEGGFHIQEGSVLQGRYRIEGLLGTGGFASVFEGFDSRLERQIAIKILNIDPLLLSEESREALLTRFLREARAAARIEHPNAVTIHDTGVLEGFQRPYIVMERLLGHDLDCELDRNGPLKPDRALRLFMRALEAIAEAHELGVVHKDLKPANLFLIRPRTSNEDMKVLDFGVARLQDQRSSLTGTGQIAGTPQYLSPEYIDHQTATPAMDVYQMALVLVEMITGQPVVNTNHTLECLLLHTSGDLPVPGWVQQGALGPVIRKALRLDHTRRYPNAREFLAALHQIDPDHIDLRKSIHDDDFLAVNDDLFFGNSDADTADALDPNLITPLTVEPDSLDHPSLHAEPDTTPIEFAPLIPDPVATLPNPPPSETARIAPETFRPPKTMDETYNARQEVTHPIPPSPRPAAKTPRKASARIWALGGAILFLVIAISAGVIALTSAGTGGPSEAIEAPLFGAGGGEPVEMTLKTSPTGASIIYNGQTLGQTPMTLRLQSEGPTLIRFEKPGFSSRSVLIDPKTPPTDPFRLEDID